MPIDPRTPVLVGVGQLVQRSVHPADAAEPADLMAAALRRAQADSEARADLLGRAQSIRVPGLLSWRYTDVGRAVAERVGAAPGDTLTTTTGGNTPQWLVSLSAAAIQRGELDVVLVVGAEAVSTRLAARRAGVHLEWTPMAEGPEGAVIGDDRPGVNDTEGGVGLVAPPIVYPLFENAIRHARGETIAEHQRTITSLWAGFSEVAAGNPHAWSPEARSAGELATTGPDNRMIAFPYPKLLNANIQTDQAAALILCSVEAARAAGVPDDRWVFPHAGADAHDHWWVSSRRTLHDSPAIRAAGRAALGAAGAGIDDIAHVDLYSCFPSAVQLAASALGLPIDDPARPLTVTGGLTFAGGPGNNYVTHSIAALADRLRAEPGSRGLVTALGWYATKHAVGVYGTAPRPGGFVHADPRATQAEVDALPARAWAEAAPDGPAALETYTVTYERDGSPALAIASCLLSDGRRAWATSTDADTMHALTVVDGLIGAPVALRDGAFRLAAG